MKPTEEFNLSSDTLKKLEENLVNKSTYQKIDFLSKLINHYEGLIEKIDFVRPSSDDSVSFNLMKNLEKHKHLSDELINIYLVAKNARNAFLYESRNNYIKDGDTEYLLGLLPKLKLDYMIEDDEMKRYLIAKSSTIEKYKKLLKTMSPSAAIGKTLGFICYNHDFSNNKINRQAAEVYVEYELNGKNVDTQIYVQMCEVPKLQYYGLALEFFMAKFVEIIQKTLGDKFKVYYKIKMVMSSSSLVDALIKKDKQFILQNLDEYANEIQNYWVPNSLFEKKLMRKNLNSDFLELMTHIWKQYFEDDKVGKIYEKYGRFSGIPDKLMVKFDNMFFSQKVQTPRELDKMWRQFFRDYDSGSLSLMEEDVLDLSEYESMLLAFCAKYANVSLEKRTEEFLKLPDQIILLFLMYSIKILQNRKDHDFSTYKNAYLIGEILTTKKCESNAVCRYYKKKLETLGMYLDNAREEIKQHGKLKSDEKEEKKDKKKTFEPIIEEDEEDIKDVEDEVIEKPKKVTKSKKTESTEKAEKPKKVKTESKSESKSKSKSKKDDDDEEPKKVTKKRVASESKEESSKRKKYDKKYQRYPSVEEDTPLYIFYTSLYEEKTESALAITWLVEHGIFDNKEIIKKYEKLVSENRLIK